MPSPLERPLARIVLACTLLMCPGLAQTPPVPTSMETPPVPTPSTPIQARAPLEFRTPARAALDALPFAPLRLGNAAQDFLERWSSKPLLSLEAQKQRTFILTYHDVIPDRNMKGAVWFDVTVDELEAQISSLRERGATFITLEQLYRHLALGETLPKKAVALTFDDNYVGFFNYGYPILKKYNIPFAMFPHTAYVGSQVGRPKMTWEQLRSVQKDGLMTLGSHSVSHPLDLGKLTDEQQLEELLESKKTLEQKMGFEIPWVSYPNGAFSQRTLELAHQVGYRMGFTEVWSSAQAAPNLLGVPRYIDTQLERGWQDAENGRKIAAVTSLELRATPVRLTQVRLEGVSLALIEGGRPQSLLTSGRRGVREFVQAVGAKAGINGSFFTDALVASNDNTMIGPVLTRSLEGAHEPIFKAEENPGLLERVQQRPLVLWSRDRLMMVPFQPESMNSREGLERLLPGVTDAFLAGAWIVHGGLPRDAAQLEPFAPRDAEDRRPRVFLGLTRDGKIVLGASTSAASTEMLARAASSAGVEEAVLLDSGYSTSLVFGQQIVAVGRKRAKQPSRLVPHAIVLLDEPLPDAIPTAVAPTDAPSLDATSTDGGATSSR